MGAPLRDSSSGAAYVYRREGSNWVEEVKLTASDAVPFDDFGWSVGLAGEFAIVGAQGDSDVGADTGAAYVFQRDGTTWTEVFEARGQRCDGRGAVRIFRVHGWRLGRRRRLAGDGSNPIG